MYKYLFLSLLILGCSQPDKKSAPKTAHDKQTPAVTQAAAPVIVARIDTTDLHEQPAKPLIWAPQEEQAVMHALTELTREIDVPSRTFYIPAGQDGTVKGRTGALVRLVRDDLQTISGKPVHGGIVVELKELTTTEELVRAGVQTVSNGRLLESGGSYYIGMSSGGEALKLKGGRTLKLDLPNISEQGMELFYGEPGADGGMNWQPTRTAFEVPPVFTGRGGFECNYNRIADTSTNWVGGGNRMAAADFRNVTSVAQFFGGAGDSTERERSVEVSPDRVVGTAQRFYREIAIQQLGWINVDRFYKGSEMVNLAYDFGRDQVGTALVYLVFKDLNGFLSSTYTYSRSNNSFPVVPAGQKATLIALSFKGKDCYTSRQEVVIAKDQKISLSLKPTSDEELAGLWTVK